MSVGFLCVCFDEAHMVSRPGHPVGDEEAEAEDEGTEQGNSSDNP